MQKSMSGIVKEGNLARGFIVSFVSLQDVGALFVFTLSDQILVEPAPAPPLKATLL